jgi:nucleoid-associated protein YgaU
VIVDTPSAGDGGPTGMLVSADDPRDGTAESTRVVPPVVAPAAPEPTLRSPGPTTTEPPVGPGAEASPGPSGTPAEGSGHASPTPSKPYVVHKGDTLVKITKEVYGKSTPDVISFVVDANKGVIKGRDSLREGQTIVTPPLPPDMFEPTSTVAGGADMKKMDKLLNPPEPTGPKPAPGNAKAGQSNIPDAGTGAKGGYIPARGAKPESTPEAKPDKPAGTDKKNDAINKAASPPKADAGKPATPPKGGKKEPTAAPKRRPSLRLYEIQPKDTFTSIAQRELGSGSRWAEIKQMNKDVDPSKMKPGMKIKIPSREPVSVQVSEKQASV